MITDLHVKAKNSKTSKRHKINFFRTQKAQIIKQKIYNLNNQNLKLLTLKKKNMKGMKMQAIYWKKYSK